MAHIRKVERRRGPRGYAWQVRYRDPDRKERSRTFLTKDQAERFARKVEVTKDEGSYINPSLGKTLFEDWAQEWMASVSPALKPITTSGYRSLLNNHVLPTFRGMTLAAVRPMDIRRFVGDLVNRGLSPSRVRSAYFLTQAIFRAAVESGYIGQTPCNGIKLPRAISREMAFLEADQVQSVADAVDGRYNSLIYVLAYGGLRWGEAAALRRKRVNLLRERLEVVESLSDVDGQLSFGPTKTYQNRHVAIPKSLVRELSQHLAEYVGEGNDALVFTSPEGSALRLPNFRRRVWWPALDKAGVPRTVRIHDLRHTCASLLIAEGAHPKAIQYHLGHSSVSVTLDRYGHLMPDEQDRIARSLDRVMKKHRTR